MLVHARGALQPPEFGGASAPLLGGAPQLFDMMDVDSGAGGGAGQPRHRAAAAAVGGAAGRRAEKQRCAASIGLLSRCAAGEGPPPGAGKRHWSEPCDLQAEREEGEEARKRARQPAARLSIAAGAAQLLLPPPMLPPPQQQQHAPLQLPPSEHQQAHNQQEGRTASSPPCSQPGAPPPRQPEAQAPRAGRAPCTLSLLTYNTWGVRDDVYPEQRMAAISGTIADIEPDFVCLQVRCGWAGWLADAGCCTVLSNRPRLCRLPAIQHGGLTSSAALPSHLAGGQREDLQAAQPRRVVGQLPRLALPAGAAAAAAQ